VARVQSKGQEIFELHRGSRRFDMTGTTHPGTGDIDRPTGPDAVDWTDEGTFERAEDARLAEADDGRPMEDEVFTLPEGADEADVLEQHLEVSDDDEDEAPREV
jgi:hypothetical protein